MPDIMHFLKLKTSPEQVYEAITTSVGVRHWWTRDANMSEEVGGACELRFYGGDKVHRITVAELAPGRRVAWDVRATFRPEWTGTRIVFDLEPDIDGTKLRFVHRGYPDADDNYAICTTGWGIYLACLQRYVETGEGSPP